jgi:antiphage defense system Thoeris ThsB-like protein
MGGGGGTRRRALSLSQLERLAKVARDQIREAAPPEKRNVFVSFAQEDLNDVNMLRGQAKNQNNDLDFNDWSVQKPFNSKEADYIKRGIRERIRQSSMVLVYVSAHSAASRWVDWEIREALTLGKSVVGVYKGDQPPPLLPAVVREKGIKLVPWKIDQLSKALAPEKS